MFCGINLHPGLSNKMALFRIFRRTFSTFKTEDVREMFRMTESGFDGFIKQVKIIKCEKGECLAEMKVEEDHANSLKGLHGGCSATLIDTLTSLALLTEESSELKPSVSVDLHLSFLKGAAVGDEIVIDAKTEKAGKNIAYLNCEVRNKATRDVLIKASHTKYFMHIKE